MTQSPDTRAEALKALDNLWGIITEHYGYKHTESDVADLETIRQALTKPEGEQEPVAWRYKPHSSNEGWAYSIEKPVFSKPEHWHWEPVFASPVSPKETQEINAPSALRALGMPNEALALEAILAGDTKGHQINQRIKLGPSKTRSACESLQTMGLVEERDFHLYPTAKSLPVAPAQRG